ncbi:DUF3025 domain-containing protein [Alteromonas sp. BL110]|uniref:DUF3025 domain-containing protein n=1 Tax=Alteromonas sp. BL110 TaxID=1714845 RepID=UPI000E5299E4|nr:DUF3025 domain-containing protein [Alteromonas sp. BL110]AXT37522.1 DUF3025 domain-containing protein [Alteromonas sp. BL110]RKM80261.1 DUF3025 domain-containing protein [Alteromonas sp. BL110]
MQSNLIPFCNDYLLKHASKPVTALLEEVGLLSNDEFPTPEQLNELATRYYEHWQGPVFKGQSQFPNDDQRYYETIISEDGVVPTREQSWHDLFNALIWLQFPKTKSLLNALHISDINTHGVNPRTARRNRITHFDECGVVLAIEAPESIALKKPERLTTLAGSNNEAPDKTMRGTPHKSDTLETFLAELASHQWERVFIEKRALWHTQVSPFIFGHANLEMMLNPFVGLTGKWLAVAVPKGFSRLDKWRQRLVLDNAMTVRIKALNYFESTPLLKPLPLLGVPLWHYQQDEVFYQNKDYFRPLREGSKPTIQLPLWS